MGYLTIIRRHAVLIVLIALVVGLAAGFSSLLQQKRYSASAAVGLSNFDSPFRSAGGTKTDLTRAMRTQMDLVTGDAVRATVVRRLGRAPHVTVQPRGQADELTIRASASTAKGAADIANAYASAYIDQLRQENELGSTTKLKSSQQLADQLRAQINSVDARAARATGDALAKLRLQHDVLLSQLKAVAVAAVTQAGPSVLAATMVQAATPPTAPSDPRPVRLGLLGLLAGLVLGFVAGALLEAVRGTVSEASDVLVVDPSATVLGPVVMPASRGPLPKSGHGLDSFRTLRASITSSLPRNGPAVITVTAPSGGEGASTVAAGLAYTLARTGKRVTLLDCNLIRPRQHELLTCDRAPGLVDVLRGTVALDDLPHSLGGGRDTLRVVPAGSPGDIGLLAGAEFRHLVDQLLSEADVVVIDAPPALASTETRRLAEISSHTLVVAMRGRTRRTDLAASIEHLGGADHRPCVVVLTQRGGTTIRGGEVTGSETDTELKVPDRATNLSAVR
jgi:Mrp family chromosome partitioning ATPase